MRAVLTSWWSYIWSAQRRVWSWTGPSSDGLSLGRWALVCAASVVVALCLGPSLSVVVLVPLGLVSALALMLLSFAATSLGRALPRASRALEYLLVALVLTLSCRFVFARVLSGEAPFNTADHQIMLARAEAFANGLYEGQWLRWTHALQGGDSLTDLYPFLANLVTAGIHVLSPKGTSFLTAYSWFVVFTWALRGFGAYFLCRRVSGPLVSALVAALALFEVGRDVWDGVWHGALYWGMIHSAFSLSIALFAAALQLDLIRAASRRRLLALAATIALTCLAHPLGILFTGLSLASLVLTLALARDERRGALRALLGSGLGFGLAGFWVLPFSYGLSHYAYSNAVGGVDYREAGLAFFDGSTPTGSYPAWWALVGLGIAAALCSGRARLVSAALLALFCWLLPLTNLLLEFRGFSLFPGLLEGQPRRLFTVLKTAAIPSTAWLLATAFAGRATAASLAPWPVMRVALLVLLGIGPLKALDAAVDVPLAALRDQLKGGGTTSVPHRGSDYEAVFGEVLRARRADASPTPWRVAIAWNREWRHAAWAEGFKSGVPLVDFVTIPANFLTYRPRELAAAALAEWNVRYVITDYTRSPFEGAKRVLSNGRFTLWENSHYEAAFVAAPPGVTISNLKLHGDTIEFDVGGVKHAETQLRVRCAWYSRWRASGAGRDVFAVLPRADSKPKQEQLGLYAANGHVVLSCDGFAKREVLGIIMTLLSAGGMVLLVQRRWRWETFALVARASAAARSAWLKLRFVAERRRALAWGLVGLLGLAVCGWGLSRGSKDLLLPPLGLPWLQVREAAPTVRDCSRHWWLARYRCTGLGSVGMVLGATGRGDDTAEYPRLWPATHVSFSTAGTMELTYSRVDLRDEALQLELQAHGDITVSVLAAGQPIGEFEAVLQPNPRLAIPESARGIGTLTLRLKAAHDGAQLTFRRVLPPARAASTP